MERKTEKKSSVKGEAKEEESKQLESFEVFSF
jgi:hypothetical protein